MAFFDSLTNLTPDQNQGLLAAAAALLQAGGPSVRPTSFGQALGSGLQAFQQGTTDAEQRRLQRQQQDLNSTLLGLKIQDAQSDLANQAATRERARKLQEFYASLGGTNPAAQVPAGQTANLAPTVENAQSLPQGAVPTSVAGDLFNQKLSEAQALRAAGFGLEADEREQAALKFRDEFDTKPHVAIGPDGKPFTYIVSKSGQSKTLVGTLPRDELKLADLGGQTVAYNPYQLQPGQAFGKTATPGELLSSATARRGQDLMNARALAAEKAPTEFQGKSAAFGLRADEANKTLNNLQGQYSPTAINSKLSAENTPFLGGILGATTNKFALSPQDQQAEQAQRDFVNAILRQESGAAIGVSEFDNARKQYFPQPGDSQQVINQKARNRQLAVQALQANAGKAKLTAPAVSNSGGWSIQRVGE